MQNKKMGDPKDHLANERTFLAWIRTCIGIMAFGFVVERFGLFMKQVAYFSKNLDLQALPSQTGSTQIFGMLLIGIGALISIFSYIRFLTTEKQIGEKSYQTSNKLPILLTLLVVLTGIFLFIYLMS